jgi:PKD repeat protein
MERTTRLRQPDSIVAVLGIHLPSVGVRRLGSAAGVILMGFSSVVAITPAQAAGPGTPTFVQATASTVKAKFAFVNPVGAGDLLVAGITANDGGTDPISGVSDSLNGTWTKVTSLRYGNGHVELYYRSGSLAGIDTVTFAGSQSAFTIAEYSGVSGSPALDQFASKASTGSPAAGPTTAITGANELVVGVGGNPAPSSSTTMFTAGTGFTLRAQAVTPWTFANGLEDSLSASNAGQSMTLKSAVSSYYGGIVAVFKSAPASAPKAALTVTPGSGAAPLSVTADASASTDPIGISSYTFAFGDGTVVGPQAGATANHTYTSGGAFTVQVTVGDSSGATASATATVSVGAPVAALNVSPNTGPTPLQVTASAAGSTDPLAITKYTFDFGDGSALVGPQAGATATHTYANAGAYTAKVTVQDSTGASAVATAGVTVQAPPVASLTVSPAAGAAPLAISADASASTPGTNPIASYKFDFGDGTTAGPQPGPTSSHTYAAGGTFKPRVTVTDSAGNQGVASSSVTVGAPTASLSVIPATGPAPLGVTANASASTDPIGISSYTFNFGDGSASVGPQAASSAGHTYTSGGTYTVTVTVADSAGASASAAGTVQVGAPVAALAVTPVSGPAPLGVTADASASADPIGIASYTFTFGDGTTVGPQSTATATHTYVAGGNFTVQVTVTDAVGVSATRSQVVSVGSPVAALNVTPKTGGAPLNVTADASGSTDPIGISTYTFDFGDGTVVGPQAGSTAAHTYNATGPYSVTVTVTDSAGGASSATAGVTVAAPPIAALTVTPASGPAPLSVNVDASASSPGTNPIATYTFDFGDGTHVGPQAGSSATHIYGAGGAYAVTVTVADTIGVSATATETVTAVAPPTAALTVSPSTGATPLPVTADASGSIAGSDPIASYKFNFGDGTIVGPQPSATATHTYGAAGSYTVIVTVTDTSGAIGTATQSVVAAAPPIASLVMSPTSGGAPLPVTADASSSVAGSNPITSYTFDFGDGVKVGPQAGATANHTYVAGGAFVVKVTVTDSAGYSSSATSAVTVGAPAANLKVSSTFGPTPLAVTADGSGSTDPIGIATYTFDFGDGTVAGPQASTSASHTYISAGTFTLTLTVKDGTGAQSTATAQVTTVTPPTAALTVSTGLGATPLTVNASGSFSTPGTNPIATYTFDFGDGTVVGPQAGTSASHVYTLAGSYVITLTVTDTQNVSSTATGSVTAVKPPTPKLTVTPPSGGVPLSVTADGSASTAGTNPIATYMFSFGDGTFPPPPSATTSQPHTYTSTGSYTVSLTVTDTAGVSATTSFTVTVVNTPTAVLSAAPNSAVAPVAVTADASGSSDPIGISSYTFDFGDGSAVIGPQPGATATHTYTTAGNYTIKVTVTDTAQATSMANVSVSVLAPPTATLSETPISGYAPLSVIANGSASAAGTYPIATYKFNFADGTPIVGPQTSSTTSHTYNTPGIYAATLTVTDTQGNSSTASATVTVSSGVLGQDTFTRPNQSGWGTASNGAPWAPAAASLSIAGNEGVVNSTASSAYELLGTATTADANGLVRFSTTATTNTVGIILRAQPNGNMYLGRYDGSGHLQFEYRVGTSWTHVSLVSFNPSPNTFYWLRFQLQGTNVNLKAWAYGTTEPSAWNWSGTSTGITAAGQMGLYSYAGAGTPVQVDTFSVSAVGNPVPNSTITGTLTDVNTGAPVAGVQVSTLPVTTTATTNSSGTYSLSLPADNFVVVFTAYGVGYNSNFVAGVQAPANGTVSANQKLTPIPAQTGMDTFTQPNQSNGFGVSTDGNVWSNDFARYPSAQAGITNGQAWVDTQASSQTDLDTWMGYQYQNEQVSVDLNMNTILVDPVFQHGARILARVQNSTTWILMTIDPTAQDLTLWATLNDNWTQLAVIPHSVSTNAWYHTKLAVIGNLVEGKVWAFGAVEPGWEITASQHIVNGTGQAGLRTTGAYVQYANFQETPITQISGVVTNIATGAPIANATITLNTGATATTDSTGTYSLIGLSSGTTYTVTASAAGYITGSIQVTTQLGTTAVGNIALSP